MLDQLAACLAKSAPQIGIGGQSLDGPGERFHISQWNQKRVEIGTGDIAATRHVGGDQRPCTSRSLQQTQRQPLTMGWQHGDVGASP